MDKKQRGKHSAFSGVIYVMGVSGCGKSTIARLLAQTIGAPFCEADELHSDYNIQKMATGTPLNDSDREPWLHQVKSTAAELVRVNSSCVVACSSLKFKYRDILRQAHQTTAFVYMKGDFETIFARMSHRTDHFMPETLLQSQFDSLEEPAEPECYVTVSIESPPEVITDQVLRRLAQI